MLKILRKFKSRRWLVSLMVVLILVGVGFLLMPKVYAQEGTEQDTVLQRAVAAAEVPIDLASNNPVEALKDAAKALGVGVEDFLFFIFSTVIGWVIWLEGVILTQFSVILLILMGYNGFIDAYAVKVGWTLIRDVANLFFVLILLIIALGTILRLESYNFKKLLPKVIIMAVLVNFSLTITGLMIDFAQVIMMTFASSFVGITGTGGGDLMNTLHINDILNAQKKLFPTIEESPSVARVVADLNMSQGATVVTGLLAVLLLLVTLVVVGIMMIVIVGRIVMLWVLAIFSPLPYILAAFPQGQRYAQQWWQTFIKYLIIGPVLAFTLWLAFAVARVGFSDQATVKTTLGEDWTADQIAGYYQQVPTDTTFLGSVVFTGIGKVENMLSLILSLAILIAGLVIAGQAGVAGGQLASTAVGRIRQAGLAPLRGAWGGVKMGARGAGRKWDREMAKYSTSGRFGARVAGILSPTVVKKGWEASRLAAEREAFPKSTGRMADFINERIRGKETFEEKIAFQSAISARQSEMQKAKLSNMENAAIFDKALESGDAIEIAAAGRVLIANNQTDDYAMYKGIEHSPSSIRKDLKKRMDKSLGRDDSANIAVSWAEYAEEVGKPRMWNIAKSHTVRDKKGKLVRVKNTWIDEDYARELLKEEGETGDIKPEKIHQRMIKELSSEWRTKADRAGNTASIRAKEGKAYLRMTSTPQKITDLLTGESYESHYTGYDEEGAARAEVEDDVTLGKIIDARPQEGQARLKEIIGAEKKDGKLRINYNILKEAFTMAKIPHQAVSALISLLKDDPEKIFAIQKKLQEDGVTGEDNNPIEFMHYANANGEKVLKSKTFKPAEAKEVKPEARAALQQAVTATTQEEKMAAVEKVEPREVIQAGQEAVEEQGKRLETASNTAEIVGALNRLEGVLEAIKIALDKLPANQVNVGAKFDLGNVLQQLEDHRSTVQGGGAIDLELTTSLLSSIKQILKTLSHNNDKNSGQDQKDQGDETNDSK